MGFFGSRVGRAPRWLYPLIQDALYPVGPLNAWPANDQGLLADRLEGEVEPGMSHGRGEMSSMITTSTFAPFRPSIPWNATTGRVRQGDDEVDARKRLAECHSTLASTIRGLVISALIAGRSREPRQLGERPTRRLSRSVILGIRIAYLTRSPRDYLIVAPHGLRWVRIPLLRNQPILSDKRWRADNEPHQQPAHHWDQRAGGAWEAEGSSGEQVQRGSASLPANSMRMCVLVRIRDCNSRQIKVKLDAPKLAPKIAVGALQWLLSKWRGGEKRRWDPPRQIMRDYRDGRIRRGHPMEGYRSPKQTVWTDKAVRGPVR